MNQQRFESLYRPTWEALDQALAKPRQYQRDFPRWLLDTCQHLAVAKSRRYSPQLIAELNHRAIRAHHLFYGRRAQIRGHGWWYLVSAFPQVLRANAGCVWLAAILFAGPLLAMALACYFNPEFVYSLHDLDTVQSYESMYDPERRKLGRERDSATDLAMFGFYIKNNIGVAFRTFAGGIFAGLGSLFFIIFNGLNIGAVAGHLTQVGYGETFYSFVVGHGSFELTAIVLAGAAGLKLGYALVAPGAYGRLDALRLAGRDAILIMYGVTVLLIIAAFIEAFWSSASWLPVAVKYGVGAVSWVLVLGYCAFGGGRGA